MAMKNRNGKRGGEQSGSRHKNVQEKGTLSEFLDFLVGHKLNRLQNAYCFPLRIVALKPTDCDKL